MVVDAPSSIEEKKFEEKKNPLRDVEPEESRLKQEKLQKAKRKANIWPAEKANHLEQKTTMTSRKEKKEKGG